MSRWIDVDKLTRRWCGMKCGCERDECGREIEPCIVVMAIEEAPSIDIVRCSECRLNETDGCPMAYCTPLEDGDFETRWWNRPDDFCSWGEREGE